jgi:hypothetical protein
VIRENARPRSINANESTDRTDRFQRSARAVASTRIATAAVCAATARRQEHRQRLARDRWSAAAAAVASRISGTIKVASYRGRYPVRYEINSSASARNA